jgi:hypothetical protein
LAYDGFQLGPVRSEHLDFTQHPQSDHDRPSARSRPGAQTGNGGLIASVKLWAP